MKGLLLKDLYMMKKYCKAYLLLIVIFVAVSFASSENLFFVFYPCLLCGMIPVNLLAYDERSRWLQYSETMPYTKGQIVSGKYVIGLATQVSVLLITGIAQAIRMSMNDAFVLGEYLVLMMLLLILSLLASSITLPFMFKLGVEKGRIINIITLVLLISAIKVMVDMGNDFGIAVDGSILVALIGVGACAFYGLSWLLSIIIYTKKEK